MFGKIPTVMTADELLDRAFGRAAKVTVDDPDVFHRRRKRELARLESVKDSLDGILSGYVKAFPSMENLPPFYRALADILLDENRLRKSLGAIDWARDQINKVCNENLGTLRRMRKGSTDPARPRKVAYGRVSSMVQQVAKDLKFLDQARNTLRRFPNFNPEIATVVVAGFPNVGKSSLIRALTDAEPEVASYPFTTKECTVGHRMVVVTDTRGRRKKEKLQFVDTPGLLDRPEEERNDIERQAALALKHLADVIVFLLDPSEHCGYPLEKQERLLKEIKKLFPRIPMFVVENKADLKASPSEYLKISATTGAGIEELTKKCIEEAFSRKHSEKLEKFLAGEGESLS